MDDVATLRAAFRDAIDARIAAEDELASFRQTSYNDVEDFEAAVTAARYDESVAREAFHTAVHLS
jgi:hypothetical protein